MSQQQERPSSLLDAAPKARRHSRYALLEDVNVRDRNRALGVGIGLTIVAWFFMLFLFNLLITHLDQQHNANAVFAKKKPKPVFDIQIQNDQFILPQKAPQPPPPQNFVETNPDAPENIPDNTNNFGARNQQAAQEVPTPNGKSDRAATEGKKDWESNQVVSGRLAQPQVQPEAQPPPVPEIKESPEVTQITQAQREQTPLSGQEKIQGNSATGYGMNMLKVPETSKNVNPDATEQIKGLPDSPNLTGLMQVTQPRIDPKHPQPRQRVERNVRPAVLAENKLGTQNVGISGIDSRWSNYGQYLQQLIDTVQIQWDDMNEKSKVYPPSGTKITVKFRLNDKGEIAEIIEADGNGGTQATRICVSAITSRSPYGKWTDDMVAMLGDSQELTFTFYYGSP